MKKITILLAFLLIGINLGAQNSKPNIIVILLDDLGFADLGFQNQSQDVRTPHIDQLASESVICENGYVSAPQCGPSRAGLMTGIHQQRFGYDHNYPASLSEKGLIPIDNEYAYVPPTTSMIPEYLSKAGYKSTVIGKWHLGHSYNQRPIQKGFTDFFGFLGGGSSYFPLKDGSFAHMYDGNDKVAPKGEYLTDLLTDAAVDFVHENKENPFFMFLSYNAPHSPMHATKKYLDRFPDVKNKKRRTFLAMMSAVDEGIGNLTKRLKELDLEENTIIFFLSDNGGPTKINSSLNDPYYGVKGDLFEGGIHVPYLIKWPAKLKPMKYKPLVSSLDIAATSIAVAGLDPVDELDGVNLLEQINATKNDQFDDRTLFWRFGPSYASRKGDIKLIHPFDEAYYTFNLTKNVKELMDNRTNDKVKSMVVDLNEWKKGLVKPGWNSFPGGCNVRMVEWEQPVIKRKIEKTSGATAKELYLKHFNLRNRDILRVPRKGKGELDMSQFKSENN